MTVRYRVSAPWQWVVLVLRLRLQEVTSRSCRRLALSSCASSRKSVMRSRISSPARKSLTRATESRRLVLTRSLGFRGINDGAVTVQG